MKRELEHFLIGDSYGGNQDWFRTYMMRMGGCAAETACDSSVYFALHRGVEGIYPFDDRRLTREDYVEFAHIMEPYLRPRMKGVNRLDIYTEGYGRYLEEHGVTGITMDTLDGTEPYEKAAGTIIRQIDSGYPVPTLILAHKDKAMKEYYWHWFLINGYDGEPEGAIRVKAVTYSEYEWVDLQRLWDTGHETKGGLILYNQM